MTHAAEENSRYGCPACLSVFRLGFSRCPIDGSVLQQLSDDPLVGTVMADRYLIEDCIGEGGMGRVYRARHQRMSRLFAIKVLFGDLATDPNMRNRFSREAESASRLSHANVISVMDFGETKEGLLYLAMDFVEGRELAEVIHDEGPFARERVLSIGKQLCQGLAHAHEERLIHRDFKGENVILTERAGQDVPKIVDFGIAVMLEEAEERLTTEGIIIGSPATMSPEQATGLDLDARSDLFSFGVVLYQMLAGVMPFEGDPMSIARQNLSVDAPRINERIPGLEVDPALEKIALKLMEKRPEDRYQSAHEVVAAFEAVETVKAVKAVVKRLEADANKARAASSPGPSETEFVAQFQGRRFPLLLVPFLFLIVAGLGAWVFLSGSDSSPSVAQAVPADASTHVPADAAPVAISKAVSADAATGVVAVDAAPLFPDSAERPPDPYNPVSNSAARDARKAKAKAERKAMLEAERKAKLEAERKAKLENKTKEPEVVAKEPTTDDLTRLYISVGESLQKLQRNDAAKAAPLRKRYSSIPFNDALRVPSIRSEVVKKLRVLRREIAKEIAP